MSPTPTPAHLRAGLTALCVALLAGCTIAKPRTDDPWEGFNRKMYAFNDAADKAVIRPTAMAYRKVTSANMRRVIANFFANIRMPCCRLWVQPRHATSGACLPITTPIRSAGTPTIATSSSTPSNCRA